MRFYVLFLLLASAFGSAALIALVAEEFLLATALALNGIVWGVCSVALAVQEAESRSESAGHGSLPDCMEWAGEERIKCRCGAEMDMSVAHLHDCEYHDSIGKSLFEQFSRRTATLGETSSTRPLPGSTAPDTNLDFD